MQYCLLFHTEGMKSGHRLAFYRVAQTCLRRVQRKKLRDAFRSHEISPKLNLPRKNTQNTETPIKKKTSMYDESAKYSR